MPNWSELETLPHFVPRRITVRGRPLHMGLGALVAGLLAGPRAPAAVLAGVLLCPLLARRALPAAAQQQD